MNLLGILEFVIVIKFVIYGDLMALLHKSAAIVGVAA